VKATERLIDVAAAVCDGAVVDWGRTESAAPPAKRHLVGHLRLLERVASAHAALPPLAAFEHSLHDSLSHPAAVIDVSRGEVPSTWGPLTIIERIGSGTFAHVYRARDPRLDRFVALKLLRHRDDGGTAVESEAIEEARLLARIDHPNVVTVHGAERIDGRVGIWMELVDGQTLEQELRDRGRFTAQELVEVGTALCRALGAVHGAGLLHRDVKAQNVMRDRDGRVLLTDFGTGRELTDLAAARALAGTPLYLAPEVLNGQPASVASDIYSLGVLLYHLATGSFPVAGRSLRDLRDMHARGARVPLAEARPGLPTRLVLAIEQAAATDMGRRYESATTFEAALVDAIDRRAARRRTRRILVALVVPIGCLLAGYAIRRWFVAKRPPTQTLAVTQLTFNSPELIPLASAIAPNGQYLAYADRTGLVLQPVPRGQVRGISLPSDVAIDNLAWLPDSIGLLAAGPQGVWRTSRLGEPPRRIVKEGGRIAVSPDGLLLAITNGTHTMRLTSLAGDDVREIDDPERVATLSEPFWSPDGRRIGYARRWQEPTGMKVAFETRLLDGGGRTVIVSGGGMRSPVWTPDGRVLFARNLPPPQSRYQDLWEVHVDQATGRPLGDPTSVWQPPEFTFGQPSLSVDGKRLAFLVRRDRINAYCAEFDAQAVEMKGLRRATLADANNYLSAWTPQGDAILLGASIDQSGADGIYRQDLDQGPLQEVLKRPNSSIAQAVMSPNGAWILFLNAAGHLKRVPASGGSPQELLSMPEVSWIRCSGASANVCLVGGVTREHLLLNSIDPVRGTLGRQFDLRASPGALSWDLSPDGTQVVSLDTSGPSVQPFLLDLATQNILRLNPLGWAGTQFVAWSADGKGWIVTRPAATDGSEVRYIDRAGQSRVLWTSTFQRLSEPMVSSDGRHIAFQSSAIESAVWMLQGF
jgi:Tol biopolymer transport system component/tRNA A-37 threonylcarbamoyl transferase component Bud32